MLLRARERGASRLSRHRISSQDSGTVTVLVLSAFRIAKVQMNSPAAIKPGIFKLITSEPCARYQLKTSPSRLLLQRLLISNKSLWSSCDTRLGTARKERLAEHRIDQNPHSPSTFYVISRPPLASPYACDVKRGKKTTSTKFRSNVVETKPLMGFLHWSEARA